MWAEPIVGQGLRPRVDPRLQLSGFWLAERGERVCLGTSGRGGERQWGRLRRAWGLSEGDVAEIGRVAPVALALLTLAAC